MAITPQQIQQFEEHGFLILERIDGGRITSRYMPVVYPVHP